jgi:hypothetical protein
MQSGGFLVNGPSYDSGGISDSAGYYYSGVPEAHIPLSGGGTVPVSLRGNTGNQVAFNGGINIHMPPGSGGGAQSYEAVRKQARAMADAFRMEIQKTVGDMLRTGGTLNPKGKLN